MLHMSITIAGGFLHIIFLVSFRKYIYFFRQRWTFLMLLVCYCIVSVLTSRFYYFLPLGPQYSGKGKSYGPAPFVGPPSEQTRLPDQGWGFPPRSMSHRNSMPFRPQPLEGPIPVSSRGIFSFCTELSLLFEVAKVISDQFVILLCIFFLFSCVC